MKQDSKRRNSPDKGKEIEYGTIAVTEYNILQVYAINFDFSDVNLRYLESWTQYRSFLFFFQRQFSFIEIVQRQNFINLLRINQFLKLVKRLLGCYLFSKQI